MTLRKAFASNVLDRGLRVYCVLPRHKADNWVGRGRGRKSTRPGANGVVELSPFQFLNRLADGSVEVSFIGKEDLLRNKRASGRHRDLGDVEELL